jgi:hypothetical protein
LADSIYWTAPYDYSTSSPGSGAIRCAPLGGGGTVETLYDATDGVNIGAGLAIDPAAGRIYWANYSDDTIRRAPLDGSGPVDTLYDAADGVNDPWGVAIDPAAGRIYWSQGEWDAGVGGTIRRAPLSGSGPVDTLFGPAQGVSGPTGLALDPAAGRIYWANGAGATIQSGPLAAGSGGISTPYTAAQGVTGPSGVAIDAAAGRICWTNIVSRTILSGPLGGGSTPTTLHDSGRVWRPGMLALDPNPPAEVVGRLEVADAGREEGFTIGRWLRDLVANLFPGPSAAPGRIYWANGGDHPSQPSSLANSIRRAPLAGGGGVDTLYGSAQGSPLGVAVLRAPEGIAPPVVSWSLILEFGGWQFGGGHSGLVDRRLSCSRGTWAADLPGCFLYRAPQAQSFSYQWQLNGADIGGATGSGYTPNAPGSYTCRVTAANRAGSASQTSAAFTVS